MAHINAKSWQVSFVVKDHLDASINEILTRQIPKIAIAASAFVASSV